MTLPPRKKLKPKVVKKVGSRKVVPTPELRAALDEEARSIYRMRTIIKEYEEAVPQVQKSVIAKMKDAKTQEVQVPPSEAGDPALKVRLVEPTSLVIDEKRLKAAIGADLYSKICTTRVTAVVDQKKLRKLLDDALWEQVTTTSVETAIDRKKLDAYRASGEISDLVIAECSHEEEKTPYVRVDPA